MDGFLCNSNEKGVRVDLKIRDERDERNGNVSRMNSKILTA